MYNCISLNKKYVKYFQILNDKRKLFNIMNENFNDYLNDASFTNRLFLYKRVKILKYNDDIIGYMWLSKDDKKRQIIKSMYVDTKEDLISAYRELINASGRKSNLLYVCEKNTYNYNILKQLGFFMVEGTYEMCADIREISNIYLKDDIDMCPVRRGIDEETRCRIQNEVFKNDARIPLTVDDIYYDEAQQYYFNEGSILVNKDGKNIGYGQIIIYKDMPTIVNVCVLEQYRKKGYGKALISHLLKILYEKGYKEVNLKVSSYNMAALNLYKSLGFYIKNEIWTWELKR